MHCMICRSNFSEHHANAASHLKQHGVTKDSQPLEVALKPKKKKETIEACLMRTAASMLARAVFVTAKHSLPFRLFDCKVFRSMLREDVTSRRVHQGLLDAADAIPKPPAQAPVSIALDEWSTHTRAYVSVVGRWLTETKELATRTIAFLPIRAKRNRNGRFRTDAATIAECVRPAVADITLTSVTTDGAGLATGKLLGGVLTHCLAHRIQLAIRRVMTLLIPHLLSKLARLVRILRFPKGAAALGEAFQRGDGLMIPSGCLTRWGSFLKVFQFVLTEHAVLGTALLTLADGKRNRVALSIEQVDLINLELMIDALTPLETATATAGAASTTAGDAAFLALGLSHGIGDAVTVASDASAAGDDDDEEFRNLLPEDAEMNNSDSDAGEDDDDKLSEEKLSKLLVPGPVGVSDAQLNQAQVKHAVQTALVRHQVAPLEQEELVCGLLHPTHAGVFKLACAKYGTNAETLLLGLRPALPAAAAAAAALPAAAAAAVDDAPEPGSFEAWVQEGRKVQVTCPVARYLGGGAMETKDPLGWWSDRRDEYGWLADAALTKLIRLPTTTACERSFSQGRRHSTHLRGRLRPKVLSALVRVGEATALPDYMPKL